MEQDQTEPGINKNQTQNCLKQRQSNFGYSTTLVMGNIKGMLSYKQKFPLQLKQIQEGVPLLNLWNVANSQNVLETVWLEEKDQGICLSITEWSILL